MQEIWAFGSRESRDQEWSKMVEALEYFAITPTQNVHKHDKYIISQIRL